VIAYIDTSALLRIVLREPGGPFHLPVRAIAATSLAPERAPRGCVMRLRG
jgi:hypothetical protein